jgi:hypothetical protein
MLNPERIRFLQIVYEEIRCNRTRPPTLVAVTEVTELAMKLHGMTEAEVEDARHYCWEAGLLELVGLGNDQGVFLTAKGRNFVEELLADEEAAVTRRIGFIG